MYISILIKASCDNQNNTRYSLELEFRIRHKQRITTLIVAVLQY